MPMSNDGFKWRPNDNSSLTNLRYSLEAEKWVNAVSAAQRKVSRGSFSGDLAVIGMFLKLILLIPLTVLLLILMGVQRILKVRSERTERNTRISEMRKKGYSESSIRLFVDSTEKRMRRNPLIFDSRGKVWAIYEFLIWFVFIFSFTIGFVWVCSSLFDPDFNVTEEPFLILVGAGSIYFALLGTSD